MTVAIASVSPLGDAALLFRLEGDTAFDAASRAAHAIRNARLQGVLDAIAAYASVAVYFNPLACDPDDVMAAVRGLVTSPARAAEDRESRLVEVPVAYDGPDLETVAATTRLSTDEVARLHSSVEYRVHAVGFVPGFAYLGMLPEELRIPRRARPRTRVPAGSVAIAADQTAVYPLETPGGWHLIGTTAVTMFDVAREQPSLLSVGDRVRFVAL